MIECNKCGAALQARQAFCPKCGELSARSAPLVERAGSVLGGGANGALRGLSAMSDHARRPENRRRVIGGVMLLAVLLIAFTSNPISSGIGTMFEREPEAPKLTADGLPDLASYEDVYVSDAILYRMTGSANVRPFPTSQNTEALFSLDEGTFVTARQVKAFDPSAQWLKLGDGQYVWGRNLAPLEVIQGGSTAVIPDFLHGTWSSMDTCRGFDANHEIVIEARTIKYYDSLSTLASISADDRGKPIYNFAISDEEWSWFESYSIMIDDKNATVFIDSATNHEGGFRPFHRPESDCASVIFE